MSIGNKTFPFAGGGALGVAVVDPITGNLTTVTSINGTVVASVVGQLTVTASVPGNFPVTQVTSPWVVLVGSSGAGFSVSQTNSPWIVQQASTGQNISVIVTSIMGAGQTFTGSVHIDGQAAHDAAVAGNPVLAAGFATASADTSAVQSGDAARFITDLQGRLIVGYAQPENFVSFTTSNLVTVGSTYTALLNAAGAGLRNYITDINVSVSSIGTVFNLMDGGGLLYSTFVDPQGGDTNVSFRTPIRGTANSSLFCQFVDSGANANVFVSGYKAA